MLFLAINDMTWKIDQSYYNDVSTPNKKKKEGRGIPNLEPEINHLS